MTESIVLITTLLWLIILLISKVRDERKIDRIDLAHFEKEAKQKKEFYIKLISKLYTIKNNEMSLDQYISEVEDKINNSFDKI